MTVIGIPFRIHAGTFRNILATALAGLAAAMWTGSLASQTAPAVPNPILFVTQVPFATDFFSRTAAFGNQSPSVTSVPRGGDLWILYPDGTLKNLTQAAGYGMNGLQGSNAIAVREPAVHWSGQKAIFSMTIGSPAQYKNNTYLWQLYEITGLGKNDQPAITKVPNQPNYNNTAPVYDANSNIVFASDNPRAGQAWLYPQLDEYESFPTNSGLWSLNPSTGNLIQLNHTPSGAFTPRIDSFGRVIYTRWDHLQRDQQADAPGGPLTQFGPFNYSSEASNAVSIKADPEVFPEPRPDRTDLLSGNNMVGLRFDQFFPWTINQDGTGEETLDHIGRHELMSSVPPAITGDLNIHARTAPAGSVRLNNFLQIREDPTMGGRYFGVDALEDGTHSAGQILSIIGPPGTDADLMNLVQITNGPGQYRDPLPLSNGTLVAGYTSAVGLDANQGSESAPQSLYAFRMYTLAKTNGYWTPSQTLTPGISKTLSYYDPNVLVSYSGLLWELDAVEVAARTVPPVPTDAIEPVEQNVLNEEGVDITKLTAFLQQYDLAIMVSRNVTTRDHADQQQPYNLKVAGSPTQTLGATGQIYQVANLQFLEGDQIRAYTNFNNGRRVLATPMHSTAAFNIPNPAGPTGSVAVAPDGSVAAFVPARKAMSWQLTDASGNPVVRERYWLTFQPGEIRTCASCHGINTTDQAGNAPPVNEPKALHLLLQQYVKLLANPPALPPINPTPVNPTPPLTPPPCTPALETSSANVPATSSTATLSLTDGAACSWTAVSNAAWITIAAGASGTGNGTVNYKVAANASTASITGTIAVAGLAFTVIQAGGPANVTFQNGVNGYTGEQDADIQSQNVLYSWNGGLGASTIGAAALDLRNTNNSGASGFESRALIRFTDISIPAGTAVVSASLTLTFVNWGEVGSLNGYYLNTAWNAASTSTIDWARANGSLLWSVPGASGAGTDRVAGLTFTTGNIPLSGGFTLTIPLDLGTVQGWIANPATNQGILLVNPTAGSPSLTVVSATGTSNRPKLTLQYQ